MRLVPHPSAPLLRLTTLAARFTWYRVPYCVIGGVAVAVRVPDRVPRDLDLIIRPTMGAGERACAAIASLVLDPRIVTPGTVTPPFDPLQILKGETFVLNTSLGSLHIIGSHLPAVCDRASTVKRREWHLLGVQPVAICSTKDLVEIKSAVGRERDQADVKLLTETRVG